MAADALRIVNISKPTHTPDKKYRFLGGHASLLGSGAHGTVHIAKHLDTQEHVAIKVMPSTMLGAVTKELTAQAKVKHPNVVFLKGTQVDLDRGRIFMIMELCRGGELFDRIAECGKLDEVVARRYFSQMVTALDHCHRLSVFHRDIKPENILLDENDQVKIADFGFSAIGDRLHHRRCGTMNHVAPEVLAATEQQGYDAAKAIRAIHQEYLGWWQWRWRWWWRRAVGWCVLGGG